MSRACRKATELISHSMDRELTTAERISLRCHLMVCGACRCYRSQLTTIRSLLLHVGPIERRTKTTRLSDEARDRIRSRLESSE